MSHVTDVDTEAIAPEGRSAHKSRVGIIASILGTTVFLSLLSLIVLTAIPYGTTKPWWRAAFVCVVFTLAIVWLIEGHLSKSWFVNGWSLVLPLVLLALFSLFQTVPFGNQSENPGGISFAPWNAISADPYQTRFFALQLLALTLVAVMLCRYANTERRLRIMINVVIAVTVASAIFGILRQTMQHGPGFGLAFVAADEGYGQFINKNHFAFLMEMSLGLILGLILAGGVKREQSLIYFAALLPLWTALVLCGSRGGLISMMAQLIAAALLFSLLVRRGNRTEPHTRVFRIARSLPMRAALILVLIAGVVFGTIWLGGDRLATRIEESQSELNSDTSELRQGVSRNEIWKATWRMFVAHPFMGVGMGGYWVVIPAFHNASGTMTPQEAHNDYLELLASGGLVGLALVLWFAVAVFIRTRQTMASSNRFRRAACFGAVIGISGVAVHSLVDFGLHTIVNALVFTTLIVIATSKPQWGNEPTKLYD